MPDRERKASSPAPARCPIVGAVLLASVVQACAGGLPPPLQPAPLPAAPVARREALGSFGARLFDAIVEDRIGELPFDDVALRELLGEGAAARAAASRLDTQTRGGPTSAERAALAGARYLGVCVQHGRLERAGGALGLARPGFVFERVLVVGTHPQGGRVAAWVEGEFLHSTRGFGAVRVRRVEAPRRDHADLELAVCELEAGTVRPPSLVVPPAAHH